MHLRVACMQGIVTDTIETELGNIDAAAALDDQMNNLAAGANQFKSTGRKVRCAEWKKGCKVRIHLHIRIWSCLISSYV